jgi:hypothetical protein
MNNVTRFNSILLLLGTLTLSACVLVNKFDEMLAVVNGNDVAFTLPEEVISNNKKFMLYGIGVSAINCNSDCVRWEMVRSIDSNTNLIEENFVKFPIKYGVRLPNMQMRLHKNLEKGDYRATATFTIIENGQIVETRKVIGGFTIE